MSYTADLHLHSRYAYATSKALSLEALARWARLKGIQLLATADFTHPAWFQELKAKLVEDLPGLYRSGGVNFVLGTEVSCVYQQAQRRRRVHLLLLAPDLATVARLNRALATHGNLALDGRPTLALSGRDFTALVLGTSPDCIVVPAHVWTPWYGVYGSKSGFDHLEECFLDMTPHIRAVETGLSSDPAMNWPVPELSDRTIVSFSDAHSLPKLGRELTVFRGEVSYRGLAEALAHNGVEYTVEFYPEEGKYHYDGHRKCGIRQAPSASRAPDARCPACQRPLTLGVLHRTQQLAVGEAGGTRDSSGFVHSPQGRPPFIRLLPLLEVLAATLGQGVATRRVQAEYQRILQELGDELTVLLNTSAADLEAVAGERLARGVLKARMGDIQVQPGYDGLFGKICLWPDGV